MSIDEKLVNVKYNLRYIYDEIRTGNNEGNIFLLY